MYARHNLVPWREGGLARVVCLRRLVRDRVATTFLWRRLSGPVAIGATAVVHVIRETKIFTTEKIWRSSKTIVCRLLIYFHANFSQ